jgi:hypothetical protein
MSQENVRVVRGMYDAYARGDPAALLAHADPAIRCYDRPDRPGAAVYIGHDGLLEFAETDREVFENFSYKPASFRRVGDHVVVIVRQAGLGRSSSVPVEDEIANVWKVRDGKCIEMRVYSSEREALEAVGLRE